MTTESTRARRSRTVRQSTRNAAPAGRRWATAASLQEAQGPLVTAKALPISGETVLLRRIDLVDAIAQKVWPEPITASVRRLMSGSEFTKWSSDEDHLVDNQRTAVLLARLSVIQPPAELVAGTITEAEITADQCVPLFVGPEDEPGEGQVILLGPGESAPGGVRLHPQDLSWIALYLLITLPGALASFRLGSGDAMAGVAEAEADGAQD